MKLKTILKRKLPVLAALALLLIFAILCPLFAGCAAQEGQEPGGGRLSLVVTTTMLYDLCRVIGGQRVQVTALMGPGIDPHLYQASAGDVQKLLEADALIYNGLDLEGKMGDVFSALSEQGRNIICIEDGLDKSMLRQSSDSPDIFDPHIWFDVNLWAQAAQYVAMRLCELEPSAAAEYSENLSSYLCELEELDAYIISQILKLDPSKRVLISAHDAFGYFGAAYGFELLSLQGLSTDAEAGTADLSRLAGFIADNEIKAIFAESSVSPKNIEALQAAVKARGFDVAVGGQLYSDSLGDAASGHETYILTLKANVDAIVAALN